MAWSDWAGGVRGAFGPVAAFDLVRSSRQARYYWLRVLYPASLLAFLIYTVSLATYRSDAAIDPRQVAGVMEGFFLTFTVIQWLVVYALTPPLVAGAVAHEKERRTLEFVLATDLSGAEVAFGKLAARLAALVTVLCAGLPVFSAIQFLGGVDPNLVLAAFASTALIALTHAGLCLALSVELRKSRDAIVAGYVLPGVYMVGSGMAFTLSYSPDLRWPLLQGVLDLTPAEVLRWSAAGNPLLQGAQVVSPANNRVVGPGTVAGALAPLAAFHGVWSVLLIGYAAVRLRPAGLRDAHPAAPRPWPRLALPRLIRQPPVDDRPVLWKERFTDRPGRRGVVRAVLLLGLFGVTFYPAAWSYWYALTQTGGPPLADALNLWVRSMTPIIGGGVLVGVAVRGAGTLTGERDKQTMDALLTTTLTASDIVWGKWAGAVLSGTPALAWLAAVWVFAWPGGGVRPELFPWLCAAWLVYAGAAAAIGVAASAMCRTGLQATTVAAVSVVLFLGGHYPFTMCLCCLPLSFGGRGVPNDVGEVLLGVLFGLTPPAVLIWLPLRAYDGREIFLNGRVPMPLYAALGVAAWAGLALAYYNAALARFRIDANRAGPGQEPDSSPSTPSP